jgi:hypothetical protein
MAKRVCWLPLVVMLLCQRQVQDNQDMDGDYLNLKLARVPSWIHPWQDPSSLLLHLQRLAPLISTWNLMRVTLRACKLEWVIVENPLWHRGQELYFT